MCCCWGPSSDLDCRRLCLFYMHRAQIVLVCFDRLLQEITSSDTNTNSYRSLYWHPQTWQFEAVMLELYSVLFGCLAPGSFFGI